jgi:hypothetical protein
LEVKELGVSRSREYSSVFTVIGSGESVEEEVGEITGTYILLI